VSVIRSICSNFSDKQNQLLDACEQLIAEGQQLPLGYAHVADQAGIRLSNCYRYFRSEQELSAALALRLFAQNLDSVSRQDASETSSWPELLRHRIESAQRVFNSNSVISEVLSNWYVVYCVNTVSFSGVLASSLFGKDQNAQCNKYFDLDDSLEDLLTRLESSQWALLCHYHQRDGYISDEAVEDLFNHAMSYLGNYLSINLPRRQDAVVED